jgi:hypothetical protein
VQRDEEARATDAVEAGWAIDALTDIVRIPSVTGDERAVQDRVAALLAEVGCRVERVEPDPAAARADPDWPGQEMPRDRLPIVLGRMGRPGGRRIVLVGHEPDLGELAARLIGARGNIEFKKGAVCLIEVDGATPGGPGTLQWMLPPKALRALAD